MKVSNADFRPKGGEIYCHIFKNSERAAQRGLYWSITIDFEPLSLGNLKCDCSATCDWIRWPLRSWKDLVNRRADFCYGENGYEASLYIYTHHLADMTRIDIATRQGNTFLVHLSMDVTITQDIGTPVDRPLKIRTQITMPFTGLIVIPENIGLVDASLADLEDVASKFMDLGDLNKPEPYSSGAIFRPVG